MQNTNPLTMYVPIYQTEEVWGAAKAIYENFNNPITKASLDAMAIVHYARIALVPNANGVGTAGILVITEFDGNMDNYLQAFFKNSDTIKAAFIALIQLWANKPDGFPTKPEDITYDIFSRFINDRDLSKSEDLYYAYPQSVKRIVAKFEEEEEA